MGGVQERADILCTTPFGFRNDGVTGEERASLYIDTLCFSF